MVSINHLDLQLTHRCNLRCIYCYAGSGTGDLPPDLPPELADAAVDFLILESGDSTGIHLNLWGGEPFLRQDLLERVAARARSRGESAGKRISIHAATNGTLLDATARELVRRTGLELTLSLDGWGPEAHADRLTAGGESAWRLIEPRLEELISGSGGRLPPVRMTITPRRAGRLAGDISRLHERGFRQISFLPASGVEWPPGATSELDRQMERVADTFISWIREGKSHPPYYPHILRRLTALRVQSRTGTLPRRAGNCGAGINLVAVDTRGDLYPCHRVVAQPRPPGELKLGSLTGGITNVSLRDRLRALSLDRDGIRCATCSSREGCLALCPAHNYRLTGDIAVVPDQACFINQCLARVAARIHRALDGEPRYGDYIEPFLEADPDERMLPILAALEANREDMVNRIAATLDPPRGKERREHGGSRANG